MASFGSMIFEVTKRSMASFRDKVVEAGTDAEDSAGGRTMGGIYYILYYIYMVKEIS